MFLFLFIANRLLPAARNDLFLLNKYHEALTFLARVFVLSFQNLKVALIIVKCTARDLPTNKSLAISGY
jgi:hypothetical protein